MIRYKGLVAPTEVPTGDGRIFSAGKATHRPMPLPVMAQFGSGGHAGATPVAKIEAIYPDQGGYWARGYFLDPVRVPEVPKAIYMLQERVLGPSVDLDRDFTVKAVPHPSRPDKKAGLFEEYNIIGMTLVPMPAFYQVHMSIENEEEKALLASAGVDVTRLLTPAVFNTTNSITLLAGAAPITETDRFNLMDSSSVTAAPVMQRPSLPFTIPGISEPAAIAMINSLQMLMARQTKLFMELKHAHWNVTGPNFIGVHEMLDTMAETVEGHVDATAERVATLGGVPKGTLQEVYAKVGSDPGYPYGRADTMLHLSYLDSCFTTVILAAREVVRDTNALDLVTQDLMTGQLQELEKAQWFIRAHLIRNGATPEINFSNSGS